MTTNHTIPERLFMLALALVSLADAAFVTARVVPVYRFLTHVEAVSAVGLLLSAALLSLGVVLIVDWRRKRRIYWNEPLGDEEAMKVIIAHYGSKERALEVFNSVASDPTGLPAGWHEVKDPVIECATFRNDDGSTSMIPLSSLRGPNPESELQRHLTDALSVMLRHPQLTVDAGTLKLLARRPKPIRDAKGRWRRVQ